MATAQSEVQPGQDASGFWSDDSAWYPCVLLKVRSRDNRPKVQWADGSISLLEEGEVRPRSGPDPVEEPPAKKRRRDDLAPEGIAKDKLGKGDEGKPAVSKASKASAIAPERKSKQDKAEASTAKAKVASPGKPLQLPLRHKLPGHKYVMAPMVGGSELPFRMLSRRYGAQLCYTPMIYSGPFAWDPKYRADPANGFHTAPGDRPLVAHFCGNDPSTLLNAARHVADKVDAIDLNLGCPQRVAHAGHFGSYLLDRKDRDLVCKIVKRLSDSLPVPVFCKIRLLDDFEETLELVRQLEASGASLIAVHARYRGSPTHRRDGPAHLEQVNPIKKVLRIPVLANGNVRSWEDVQANLESTGADGIMSAEGILDDPCLFGQGHEVDPAALRKLDKKLREIENLCTRQAEGAKLNKDEEKKILRRKEFKAERKRLLRVAAPPQDGLETATLYLEEIKKYWIPPVSTIVFHCRRMAKAELTKYQLLEEFVGAQSLDAVEEILKRAIGYRDSPDGFAIDPQKAQKEKELREQRAYEQQCRKKFEERMARKAARTGQQLSDLLKATACPGGLLEFDDRPSWLLERDDNTTPSDSFAGEGGGKKGWDKW